MDRRKRLVCRDCGVEWSSRFNWLRLNFLFFKGSNQVAAREGTKTLTMGPVVAAGGGALYATQAPGDRSVSPSGRSAIEGVLYDI
jgi:hypothetical protein